MSKLDVCRDYFSAFERKDLVRLSNIYADNVSLVDWEVSVEGKDKLLEENSKLFKSSGDISIELKKSYQDADTVICELQINLDKPKMLLKVTDIIGVNNSGQIASISAYKQ